MIPPEAKRPGEGPADPVDQAASLFLRRRSGAGTVDDRAALDSAFQDPAKADALHRVCRTWNTVGAYADSPELIRLREHALARARRASVRRWDLPRSSSSKRWALAASIVIGSILAGVTWQLSPYGFNPGVYETRVGEQRRIELEDHSTVVLDAKTRLRIRYSADARVVEIIEGQAQFSVTEDPTRPFKVIAGNRTIVALGTIFTVEYLDHQVQVSMLEGRVAVFSPPPPQQRTQAPAPIELHVGEALQVRRDGSASLIRKADLTAATAWRRGQVIFHDEPLEEAVRRLNRYSRVQLRVQDPELAQLSVSGLFDTGDTRAFAHALQSYLPVTADESDPEVIRLRKK